MKDGVMPNDVTFHLEKQILASYKVKLKKC